MLIQIILLTHNVLCEIVQTPYFLRNDELQTGAVLENFEELLHHVVQTDEAHLCLLTVYVDEQMVKHMLTVQQVMVQTYNVQTVIVQIQPSLV